MLPAILHERFGQKHFGSIWAFSQTAMVTSSLIFATGLAAAVYETHAGVDAAGVQARSAPAAQDPSRCPHSPPTPPPPRPPPSPRVS